MIASLTIVSYGTYAFVVISPNTITNVFLHADSHATLEFGSYSKHASKTLSLIKSHNLSGWPALTLSEVNKKCPFGNKNFVLCDDIKWC